MGEKASDQIQYEAIYFSKSGGEKATESIGKFKSVALAQKAVEKHALRHEKYHKLFAEAKTKVDIPDNVKLIVVDSGNKKSDVLGTYRDEVIREAGTDNTKGVEGKAPEIRLMSAHLEKYLKSEKLTPEQEKNVVIGVVAHEASHAVFQTVLRNFKEEGRRVTTATSNGSAITQSLRDENPTYFAMKSFFENDEIISSTQNHTDYAKTFMKDFLSTAQYEAKTTGQTPIKIISDILTGETQFNTSTERVSAMGKLRDKFELAVNESLAEVSYAYARGEGSNVPPFLKDFRDALQKSHSAIIKK